MCFAGYRLAYWIIGLCGFSIVSLGSFLLLSGYDILYFPLTIALSLLLGILGSLLAVFYYRSGVFLIGMIAGFIFGNFSSTVTDTLFIILLSGLIGGILSYLIKEEIFIVVTTSIIGSLLIMWALFQSRYIIRNIISLVSTEYPPDYFQIYFVLMWLGLGLLGCAVQYKYFPAKSRKKKIKTQEQT